MPTHADTHDLDKLRRWHKDLETTTGDAPPVFAIFLVSGEDRAAHDVFRAFRSGFEELSVGFAHLVIFGQHGVSDTARRLRARFGLEEAAGPSLVLFSGHGSQPQVVSLPAGDDGDAHPDAGRGWRDALDHAVSRIGEKVNHEAALLEGLREICVELGNLN